MKEPNIQVIGDNAIRKRPMAGLLCSSKCPGKLILDTYDLVRLFRKQGVTVISGFYLPMEGGVSNR